LFFRVTLPGVNSPESVMKRIIVIIGVILLIPLFLIYSLPFWLSVFELDVQIKNYIVHRIGSGSDDIISIEDIEIGIGKIELTDIKFVSYSSNANFLLKGIEFRYSLIDLLLNISEPQKSINNIFLGSNDVKLAFVVME